MKDIFNKLKFWLILIFDAHKFIICSNFNAIE